jgi:hypothetical protein
LIGLQTWRKLFLGAGRRTDIPSLDYYFLGALHDLVDVPNSPRPDRPIVRCGPTTFFVNDRLVIIRYLSRRELTWIRARRFKQVYYVLDDMLPLAERCYELPVAYRKKLARFAREMLPAILALNPTILAPSEEILALFPQRPVEFIEPCCLQAAQDFSHFGSAESRAAELRMAFLGTRSHGAGIEFLSPILEALRDRTNIRCSLFFGKDLPMSLKRVPFIDNRAPLSWVQFKQFAARERYHIVLAPLPDTTFNRGRSISKLLDTAAVGAAGLFSARMPFSRAITHREDGLLLGDDPAVWRTEIERLIGDLKTARVLAENAAITAQRLGSKERLRAFWIERLEMSGSIRMCLGERGSGTERASEGK